MTDAFSPISLPGAPLPLAPRQTGPDEMRRAAEEFEAVFLAQMLAPMFEGLQTDGLGGGGLGEEIFRPMLIERYAEALSKAGGVGIADSVVREMMRLQQTQAATGTSDGVDR
jgi:Rod binding domain-containing protein